MLFFKFFFQFWDPYFLYYFIFLLLYFPSFSVGAFGDGLRNNFKFSDGFSIRFYTNEFPERFRHNEFLVSAGHLMRSYPDCYNDMGFTDENLIMGDSGGYQICSGAVKWNPDMKGKVFHWLENNSDIAMNLDIPPRAKPSNKAYIGVV